MTAKDLLDKILEYKCFWAFPSTENSKPAKIRLAQIEALLSAFGLSKKYVNPLVQIKYSLTGEKQKLNRAQHLNKLSNLEYLITGEFLRDRDGNANREVSERALAKIKALFTDLPDNLFSKPVDISWMFNDLFNFRKEIHKITFSDNGMLEGFSVGLHYSFYLQGKLKEAIKNNLSEIDETLWLILDPLKREIDKQTINYPEADLIEIDLESRMANY
jgi:hypothetical protein